MTMLNTYCRELTDPRNPSFPRTWQRRVSIWILVIGLAGTLTAIAIQTHKRMVEEYALTAYAIGYTEMMGQPVEYADLYRALKNRCRE